ncbi:MAG: GNAT family N-acetyltransferase [Betaproteobacteria bacterium]|nr:GNAT family N-acetyltransferase [Betaproteobacteria bacterium]
MTIPPDFRVRLVEWPEACAILTRIRTTVFVEEQNVPAEIEMDGRDGECAHALAESEAGEAIGTGRLMRDGRIGRMAVLAPWRRKGVGAAILDALMAEARRRGFRETYLHAQSHAQVFYARHGYVAEGEEYLEAGIPHIRMRAPLGDRGQVAREKQD